MTPAVTIISFGYLHGAPPAADLTVDLRAHFRDPHADPALRELTAADPRVMAAVLATPGIPRLVSAIVSAAGAYAAGPSPAPLTVAVGCAGGRHRAAAVAITVARMLASAGVPAALEHRDISRPVRRPS
jgi:UPF0042 nucleotide-binding protein